MPNEDLDDFYFVSNMLPLLERVHTVTSKEVAASVPSRNGNLLAPNAPWCVRGFG